MAPTQQVTPLFRLLTPLLQNLRLTAKPTITSSSFSLPAQSNSSHLRNLSTSSALLAGRKNHKAKKKDPKITLIRYHLQHPLTPRPLRLSRMRSLRHWTIHRAWMLARRNRLERENIELERMYQSMRTACEELRLLDAPDAKDAGKLYRIAMEKRGIFRHGGLPIEYARAQTETPGIEAWNHGWTR